MKRNAPFSVYVFSILFLMLRAPLVTEAQLFDGEREGLLLGAGVGYAAIASGGAIEGSAAGFAVSGKLGYGLSDQLAVYLSSTVPSVLPGLGFLYFTDRNSDYYLTGLLGYVSGDQDSILSISGGIGYELRDHISLELILGYNRVSDTYTRSFNIWTGEIINETSESRMMTIAATFNVHFY